jgi:hypothetical protein
MISVKLEYLLVERWGSVAVAWPWMVSPNPDLDGLSPWEVCEKGHHDVIEDMVEDMLLGHPS